MKLLLLMLRRCWCSRPSQAAVGAIFSDEVPALVKKNERKETNTFSVFLSVLGVRSSPEPKMVAIRGRG